MVFELPQDAPGRVVERVERTHEFLLNQLGIHSNDVVITAAYNVHGDEKWVIEMQQFEHAAGDDMLPDEHER